VPAIDVWSVSGESWAVYYPVVYLKSMPTRNRIRSTHALVLRRHDINDADRVLTVLTPRDGKLELIAKGVRKTNSRKAGHLELFVHASLLVAQARTWDMITEVQTVESFRHLRNDLDAIAAASYVCELVDSFAESGDEVQPVWDLVLSVLRELDAGVVRHELPANLLRWFDLQLLSLTGFQPQLFHCLVCERLLEPMLNFINLYDGGVLCPDCGGRHNDAEPLDADTLKVLRFLQRQPWTVVSQVRVRSPVMRRVESLLQRYLIIVLERQLRSTLFLRRLASIPVRLEVDTGE